jgi:plasmid stability protein
MPAMPAVVIRNLPEATHRALKLRAARNGRSTEAEIRAILEQAANPPQRIQLGSELAAIGRRIGGVDLRIERDKAPAETTSFE